MKHYYVTDLYKINDLFSNGILVNKDNLVSENELHFPINKIAISGKIPVIFEVDDFILKYTSNIVRLTKDDLLLANPYKLNVDNTLTKTAYDEINKVGQFKKIIKTAEYEQKTVQSIFSKIINENPDKAKNFIKIYSSSLLYAKDENIKNAEKAALMTAIKKTGVNYAG